MVFYSRTHNSTYVIQVGHTYYRCAYHVSKHCQRQRKIGSGTTATLRWRLYTIVVEHHRIYDIIIQYSIILTIIAGSTSHATPAGWTEKREQKTRLQGHLNGQTSRTERQKVHNTGRFNKYAHLRFAIIRSFDNEFIHILVFGFSSIL